MAIDKEVLGISKFVAKNMSVDMKTGLINTPENVYEQVLPEDLSMEIVQKVAKHNTNFVAGATHAFGQVAQDILTKNSDLESANGFVCVGSGDVVELNYKRCQGYDVPGESERQYKYGVATADYYSYAVKPSSGLKEVCQELSELAHKAFADK